MFKNIVRLISECFMHIELNFKCDESKYDKKNKYYSAVEYLWKTKLCTSKQ